MNNELEQLKEEAKSRVEQVENEIKNSLTPDEYISYLLENNKNGTFTNLINKIKSNIINVNNIDDERKAYNELLKLINNKKQCSYCGSNNTIPYYYGVLYPNMIESTDIVLDSNFKYGGLEKDEESNDFYCNNCHSDFN